jgi:hypothetical protein
MKVHVTYVVIKKRPKKHSKNGIIKSQKMNFYSLFFCRVVFFFFANKIQNSNSLQIRLNEFVNIIIRSFALLIVQSYSIGFFHSLGRANVYIFMKHRIELCCFRKAKHRWKILKFTFTFTRVFDDIMSHRFLSFEIRIFQVWRRCDDI